MQCNINGFLLCSKDVLHNILKLSGIVDGKGHLKWFKVLNWISAHAGEVVSQIDHFNSFIHVLFQKKNRTQLSIELNYCDQEVPPIFLEKYGDDISDDAEIYLPDGMVYGCNYSKTKKLLSGIKNMMNQYGVKEDFTLFFEYLGDSKFYCSIFNVEGLEIFNSLQEKLLSYNLVKLIAADGDISRKCF